MKYKVIGWTYYEDYSYKCGDVSYAVQNAIIKEIIEKGYFFSGYDHQESLYCCPILNNGKRYLFSQRGWAGLMAESRGERGVYDYARYMFGIKQKYCVYPSHGVDDEQIKKQKDLAQEYKLKVDKTLFSTASKERKITFDDKKRFSLIESGDFITLICEDKTCRYKVIDVDRRRKVDRKIILTALNSFDEKEKAEAQEKIEKAKDSLILKLRKIRKV